MHYRKVCRNTILLVVNTVICNHFLPGVVATTDPACAHGGPAQTSRSIRMILYGYTIRHWSSRRLTAYKAIHGGAWRVRRCPANPQRPLLVTRACRTHQTYFSACRENPYAGGVPGHIVACADCTFGDFHQNCYPRSPSPGTLPARPPVVPPHYCLLCLRDGARTSRQQFAPSVAPCFRLINTGYSLDIFGGLANPAII